MNVQALQQHAQRLETKLKNFQKQGAAIVTRGKDGVLTLSGAAVSGFSQVYLPKVPGTEIDTDLAVGSGLLLLGVFDLFGVGADELTDFGAGLAAPGVSRGVVTMLQAVKR